MDNSTRQTRDRIIAVLVVVAANVTIASIAAAAATIVLVRSQSG